MKRVCYGCEADMTLSEAVNGQLAMTRANRLYPEFAGWVHCQGDPPQFVQENDTSLRGELETYAYKQEHGYYRGYDIPKLFFPGSIQICSTCIEGMLIHEGYEYPIKEDVQELLKKNLNIETMDGIVCLDIETGEYYFPGVSTSRVTVGGPKEPHAVIRGNYYLVGPTELIDAIRFIQKHAER